MTKSVDEGEVGEAKKVEKCQRRRERARAKLKMRRRVKNGPTREISPPDLTV